MVPIASATAIVGQWLRQFRDAFVSCPRHRACSGPVSVDAPTMIRAHLLLPGCQLHWQLQLLSEPLQLLRRAGPQGQILERVCRTPQDNLASVAMPLDSGQLLLGV